jgi:hypothetical protein
MKPCQNDKYIEKSNQESADEMFNIDDIGKKVDKLLNKKSKFDDELKRMVIFIFTYMKELNVDEVDLQNYYVTWDDNKISIDIKNRTIFRPFFLFKEEIISHKQILSYRYLIYYNDGKLIYDTKNIKNLVHFFIEFKEYLNEDSEKKFDEIEENQAYIDILKEINGK